MSREVDGRRQSQPQTPGIFSGVFNFVSREIESFVTNATGGAEVSPVLLYFFAEEGAFDAYDWTGS